jgi:TonB family protein
MNRLQKKCVIATAGFHLLLLVILFVGPAFFNSKPKPDDSQVLEFISPNLIDAELNSGVKGAQPPPPAPTPVVTPPQPQPAPPAPKPIVQPAPAPQPTFMRSLENLFTPAPKPEPAKPAPVTTPNQQHKIQVDLHQVVRNPSKNSPTTKPKNDSQAIKNIADNLRHNLSSPTEVSAPGESSAANASYKDALATIYYNAWTTPDDTANDEANTTVKITVASDGTVINARIITPSGDAKSDDSVQRTLERVASVPPLPDKSKTEQDFVISFNLKAKRMLE